MAGIVDVRVALDVKKLKNAVEKIASLGVVAEVGFFENAKYPDGTLVAQVAYMNEYGAGGNPKRPFMKRTVEKNHAKWVKGITYNLRGSNLDAGAIKNAFEMAARVAEDDVKETIAKWPDAAPRLNSPKTIEAKRKCGRSGKNAKAVRPTQALVDTSKMIGSVHHKVKVK